MDFSNEFLFWCCDALGWRVARGIDTAPDTLSTPFILPIGPEDSIDASVTVPFSEALYCLLVSVRSGEV